MKFFFSLLLFVLIIPQHNIFAQAVGGNSLVVIAPTDPFNELYSVGVSFNGNLEIPIPTLNSLLGNIEIGYQSWSPENDNGIEEENSLSIGAGGKYFLNSIFLGADAVYFFGNIKELTFVPNAGIRIGKINIEASTSIHNNVPFLSLELGYFWATN